MPDHDMESILLALTYLDRRMQENGVEPFSVCIMQDTVLPTSIPHRGRGTNPQAISKQLQSMILDVGRLHALPEDWFLLDPELIASWPDVLTYFFGEMQMVLVQQMPVITVERLNSECERAVQQCLADMLEQDMWTI